MLKNKTILWDIKCPISPSLMSLNSNDEGKNKADVFNIFYTLSLSFVISIWGQSSKRMCLCLCLISIFFTQKWKTSFGGFSGGRSNAASSSSRCHVSVLSKNTYSEHWREWNEAHYGKMWKNVDFEISKCRAAPSNDFQTPIKIGTWHCVSFLEHMQHKRWFMALQT